MVRRSAAGGVAGQGERDRHPVGDRVLQRDGVLRGRLDGGRRGPPRTLRRPDRAGDRCAVPGPDIRVLGLGRRPVPGDGARRRPRGPDVRARRARTRPLGPRPAVLRDELRPRRDPRRCAALLGVGVPRRGSDAGGTRADGPHRDRGDGPGARDRLAFCRARLARRQWHRRTDPGGAARAVPPVRHRTARRTRAPGDVPGARLARRQRPPRRADRPDLGRHAGWAT